MTPEQILVVWKALQQFVDNQAERFDDLCPTREELSDEREAQVAQNLIDGIQQEWVNRYHPESVNKEVG